MSNKSHKRNAGKQSFKSKKVPNKPAQSEKKNNNVATFKEQGDKHYQNKQYRKAIQCYEKALGLDSAVKQIWLNNGLCYKELNERDEAITAFYKAIELDSLYVKAVYNLVSMFPNDQQKALEVIGAYKTAEGDDKNVLALEEKIRSEMKRHTPTNNSSPDSTVDMLKMMREAAKNKEEEYGKNSTSAMQDTSDTDQNALPHDTDAGDIIIPGGRRSGIFAVLPRTHELSANAQEIISLNEVVAPSIALKASKCYWIVSYLSSIFSPVKGEYIARDFIGCKLVLMEKLPPAPTPDKGEMYLATRDDKLEYVVWTPKDVIVKGTLERKEITRLKRVTLDSLESDSWESNMLRFEILEATAKNGHTFRSLHQMRPAEGFSYFHTEDEAMKALIKFYMHGQNLHLVQGFIFEMDATVAEFRDLSIRVQLGEDKVPEDLIKGWKAYRYDDKSKGVNLVEEKLQDNQTIYKPF